MLVDLESIVNCRQFISKRSFRLTIICITKIDNPRKQ